MASYRLIDGIHRCVAARMAGLEEISAVVDRDGVLSGVVMIPLNELYSPKSSIGRWDRGRDFFDLVAVMADPLKRATMRPIIAEAVMPPAMKYLTPVSRVALS
ncbi:MAG: ParB/Srx family N-terminal domain-containing protein [Gemmataceae bacterium]